MKFEFTIFDTHVWTKKVTKLFPLILETGPTFPAKRIGEEIDRSFERYIFESIFAPPPRVIANRRFQLAIFRSV